MVIPPRKDDAARRRRRRKSPEIEEQYTEGLITDGERYNKVVDIWAQVAEQIAKEMMNEIGYGGAVKDDETGEKQQGAVVQPDLHHGRLGRAWLGSSRSGSWPVCAA